MPSCRFRISKTKYHPEPGVDGALVTFELLPPTARVKVRIVHRVVVWGVGCEGTQHLASRHTQGHGVATGIKKRMRWWALFGRLLHTGMCVRRKAYGGRSC